MKFSANLGFLWKQLPLTNAIYAAKEAGFDAVECHWPYDVPSKDVAKVLKETNFRLSFSDLNISAPALKASLNRLKPAGIIINS